MEICKVLSGFGPICPSEFELSSEAISSGKLPEPALFFTWYCEKAREIEKYTGSVEFSLKLLDLALENLPSNSKIAKRFILATRQSLHRYNAYINSLASKLEQEGISTEEKTKILETIRTIDLKTFETGGSKKSQTSREAFASEVLRSGPSLDESCDAFNSEDWTTELEILNHILENRFDEAFLLAQQSVFFPSALQEKFSNNPVDWLILYCKNITIECDNYIRSVKEDDSVAIISPKQCEDVWTDIVNSYLGADERPFAKEQTVCLILTKCKMAETILKLQTKRNLSVSVNTNSYEDEESYF